MDKNRKKKIFVSLIILLAMILASVWSLSAAADQGAATQKDNTEQPRGITPPFDGPLKYPFTKKSSVECGRWRSGSQDYPYFGAPRDGNTRKHAGIDIYPVNGEGTPVRSMLDGTVVMVAPFYTRRNGEATYAVLVDHNEFVANYAELKKPSLSPGKRIKQNQIIGMVSGTKQLHLELYTPGTKNWTSWYGKSAPPCLIDPTDIMTKVFGIKYPLSK